MILAASDIACGIIGIDDAPVPPMHDPVPGKRHLDKSADILLTPAIDQPDCILIRTDNTKRSKIFPSLIRNLELKITISQASYYLFRTLIRARVEHHQFACEHRPFTG